MSQKFKKNNTLYLSEQVFTSEPADGFNPFSNEELNNTTKLYVPLSLRRHACFSYSIE